MADSSADAAQTDQQQEFVRQLTRAQSSLYAYIYSLMPDPNQAEDLLQETNTTLWKKATDFEPGTSFLAWSCQVAYFKVLSQRRKLARDRHLFDDALVDYLAERQAARLDQLDSRRDALRGCIQKLPPDHREMVEKRYKAGGSVQTIAQSSGRSAGVVSQTLYRIRTELLDCIRSSLQLERA